MAREKKKGLNIERYRLGQMQVNCYFLIKDDSCLILDPGDEASFILEEVVRRKLKPVGLLATHGHFDHVMAAGEIQMISQLPLNIHQNDLFLLKRVNQTAKYFLGYDPVSIFPKEINYIKEGNIKIGDYHIQIIETPGHTPGSICYYFEKERIIFTGDTLLKEGIGRYDFSYSDFEDLQRSLKKLFKLPKDTIVYPGHGEQTTIGQEEDLIRID